MKNSDLEIKGRKLRERGSAASAGQRPDVRGLLGGTGVLQERNVYPYA